MESGQLKISIVDVNTYEFKFGRELENTFAVCADNIFEAEKKFNEYISKTIHDAVLLEIERMIRQSQQV